MQDNEQVDDAVLMQRVAAGDTAALCVIIDRWQVPLGNFIRRYVQNHEAAQELVQETFVRLYEARARYDSNMKFSSWLFKIAANLCKNYYRWRSRHPECLGWDENLQGGEEAQHGMYSKDPTPVEESERREDIAKLERAMCGMPHQLKTTLLLYYYESMSYKEIAHSVGCSARGVETRLYRARAWLAKKLCPGRSEKNAAETKLLFMHGIQM